MHNKKIFHFQKILNSLDRKTYRSFHASIDLIPTLSVGPDTIDVWVDPPTSSYYSSAIRSEWESPAISLLFEEWLKVKQRGVRYGRSLPFGSQKTQHTLHTFTRSLIGDISGTDRRTVCMCCIISPKTLYTH